MPASGPRAATFDCSMACIMLLLPCSQSQVQKHVQVPSLIVVTPPCISTSTSTSSSTPADGRAAPAL